MSTVRFFLKGLKNIKNQIEPKNTITEIKKNSLKGINSRWTDLEKWISKLEERILEITQAEKKNLYFWKPWELIKVIEDNTTRWKDILFLWIGRINTVKMIILLKAIYRFNAISNKISTAFFHKTGTKNSKMCIRTQKKSEKVKALSCVQLFATQWTVAYQALPSMVFSRQEYWSGLPFPSSGNLPNPGIEPRSPAL